MLPSRAALGERVAHGIFWQYGLTAFRVLVTVGSTAVLARLLHPSDYGLVAMAALLLEMAGLIANTGFGSILVQRRRLSRLSLDTAFWASILLGMGLAALIVALAKPAALFFAEPALFAILCVSSLNFVINGAAVVPTAILSRLLRFKTDALIQILQLLIKTAVAIGLAWEGYGYWSLVVAGIAATLVGTLMEFVVVAYVPRRRFSVDFVRQNIRASGSYLGSSGLAYFTANFDQFVVGRQFGAEQLGFYQAALSLPSELRNRLSAPLQRVLFPAYALLQDDTARFRAMVAKSQKLLTVIVMPIAALMAVGAKDIVAVLYGPKWTAVVPLLQILAMGGALRALFSLVGNIFFAVGRPDLAMRMSLLATPTVIIGVWAGSHWGSAGVAWAMLFSNLWGLYSAHVAMRLIGGSLNDFLRAIGPAVACSAACALTLGIWQETFGTDMSALLSLGVGVPIALTLGLVCIYAVDRSTVQPLVLRALGGVKARFKKAG